jgi:hypothetical protein
MLVLAFGLSRETAATEITAIACPGAGPARPSVATAAAIGCDYQLAPGFQPSHDGGPWVDVDLMAAPSLQQLQALRAGTSGQPVYPGGPALPPLGLVHAQICLSDPNVIYHACPNNYPNNAANLPYGYLLNPAVISKLEQGLALIRQAKLKVVLRFTYNWPCPSPPTPPPSCNFGQEQDAPIDVILQHMQALAPTIQNNSDVIFALQAGFIGRWGEWHDSTNGNDTPDRHNRFLDQYTALFQGRTNLEVRYPYVLLDYAHHRFGSQGLRDLLALGIGLHDDEFGSNPSDGGTFLPAPNPSPPFVYPACLLEQTAAAMARAYTMTGEVTATYNIQPSGSCPIGVPDPTDFQSFAASYSLTTVQLGFAPGVWRNWVQTGKYNGILAAVGPHLSLISATLSHSGAGPAAQNLLITFQNAGWAALSRRRPLWLVIKQGEKVVERRSLAFDLGGVSPGQSIGVRIPLSSWETVPPGTYTVSLWAPESSDRLRDDPSYALLFENLAVGDPTTGLNTIASFVLANP